MTKILELPEDLAAQLEKEAREVQMEPEAWAIVKLQRPSTDAKASGEIPDEDWKRIARGVINENRELLKRLAQ